MRLAIRLLAVVLVLAAGAVGTVYALSARVIAGARDVVVPPFARPLPTDSASLAEGERFARVRGCTGCHGADLGGEVFFDEPNVARVVAPNLPALAARVDDATLERAIRHGIGHDGRALFAMPAEMYRIVTDDDLARLLAWVRSRPVPPDTLAPSAFRLLGRVGIATGEFLPSRHYILTEPVPPAPADSVLRLGHYIAWTSCTECHGGELEGDGARTPALQPMMALYTPAELAAFFASGTAKGGRELRLMSDIARGRLSHLRPGEVAALHAYLTTLPAPGSASPPPPPPAPAP